MSPKSEVAQSASSNNNNINNNINNNNNNCNSGANRRGNFGDQKEKIKSQILRIRIERDFAKQRQVQSTEKKRHRLKEATHNLQKRNDSFFKDNSVRAYAPYMRSSEMPTYLLVLQAKVLKLLHQLSVVDEQKKLVELQCRRAISGIRKEICKLGEEKTELELKMLNYMVKIQTDEQDMHKSYGSLLSQQTEELEVLQEAVDQDDELDQVIDQITSDSVMVLKGMQDEAPIRQKQPSRNDSSSSLSFPSFSSFRLRTPTQTKKTKKLTLQEILSTTDKKKHARRASTTESSTYDDSSSRMSFSVKMSRSLGFIFDNHNKRDTSPRDESML